MSRTLTAASEVVPAGTITFYDSSNAPLPAATYTLKVTQSVELGPDHDNPPDYQATQTISVTAPRFQIQPSDLQSVFPPSGALGTFAEALPQIVLTRDVPWARPIVPGEVVPPADTPPPWLALLVVYESEAGNVGAPITTTVQTLMNPGNGVLPPDLGSLLPEELSQVCQVLTVNLSWFQSVIPALDELPLLAHARNVDTSQKVTNLANGFWSVLIGNRLPDSASDGPRVTTVYLVSLEGHSQHLHGATVPGNYQSIALAALARWTFTCAAFQGDFLGLLQAIGDNGQDQRLQMLTDPAIVPQSGQDPATESVAIGFVPLQNDLRTGETTSAWYRSPIVPFPTQPDPVQTTYPVSDHAIRYDPETGMFDHSYAAAWQVGRLLGLNDAAFTQSLNGWRRSEMNAVQSSPALQKAAELLQVDALELGRNPKQQLKLESMGRLAAALGASKDALPLRKRRGQRNLARGGLARADDFRLQVAHGEDPLELLLNHLNRHR
jgi:hypothetical protein